MRIALLAASMALLALLPPRSSVAQDHLWSRQFGGTGNDRAAEVEVDSSGDLLVTGWFSGTVDFGGGPLVSAGGRDIFLARFDSTGSHIWSRRFGSTLDDFGNGLAINSSGNIILTGSFRGTVNFGGSNLTASDQDIFLATFASDGSHLWSIKLGGTGGDRGADVVVDGPDNVIVTGDFNGTVNFGGGSLVSAGSSDIFLARYTPLGAHIWSKRFGGTGSDSGIALAFKGPSAILLTGAFSGTADFGGGPLTSTQSDIFVARFNLVGVHQWSRGMGGTGFDSGVGIQIDASGNVVVTGSFANTVDFGGGGLTSNGLRDIFLAKYDGTGAHVWSYRFGGAGDDFGNALAVDGSGNIFATGSIATPVDFGGGAVAQPIVLIKFDGAGAHSWSRGFAGTGLGEGWCLDTWNSGDIALGGDFYGTFDFGGGPFTGPAPFDWDMFLARFRGTDVSAVPDPGTPTRPALLRNFPNPFGRQTTIEFATEASGDVSMDIFDATGGLVRRLMAGHLQAGTHHLTWDGMKESGEDAADGIYFYRLAGSRESARKMLLVR